MAWLKRLIGIPETPMESFLRKGKAAQAMLDAARVKVPDTRLELRRATEESEAFGVLRLLRDPETNRIPPERSRPVFEAIRIYRKSMEASLTKPYEDQSQKGQREAAILTSRRALVISLPVTLTSAMMAEMDKLLGLPPIDPALGLG